MTYRSCAGLVALLFATVAVAQSPGPPAARSGLHGLTAQLAALETGFFHAWQTNDPGYFRAQLAPEAVFFGVYGVSDKASQVDEIVQSAHECKVQSYRLTNFHAIQWTSSMVLLTYRAEQHADCGGPVPVAMNGSTVYRFHDGGWQAVYRSEVPARDWGPQAPARSGT